MLWWRGALRPAKSGQRRSANQFARDRTAHLGRCRERCVISSSAPLGPRIGLPPALLFGRRRHAFLIVLDLRCVWLSAFSTAVVRQVRLRAGTWWGGRLGHDDAPSSIDQLPEPASGLAGPSGRQNRFNDCVRTACAIFLWLLRGSASVREVGSAPRD